MGLKVSNIRFTFKFLNFNLHSYSISVSADFNCLTDTVQDSAAFYRVLQTAVALDSQKADVSQSSHYTCSLELSQLPRCF